MCELCNLQKETEWYYEDDDFVICDCSRCIIPMIVYKHHTMTVPLDHMIRIMLQTKKLFGWKARIRANQRKISSHWHVHILTTNKEGEIMAKIVSDSLVIKIARKGEEKIHDLGKLFNENPNRVISIVGTVNEDGSPNTAPMSLFYSPEEKIIIAGMVKTAQTVANIKRDGRVIIEVLYEGDIGFGISGRGKVIKEPLDSSDATLAVKIDVTGVKRDTSPAQIVTSGPRSTPRSEKAVEYEKAVWEEIIQIKL